MSKIEKSEDNVIEIVPEKKEGFFKKAGNGIKVFWNKNKWWICGMAGAIAGVSAAHYIQNKNDGGACEDPNVIDVGDDTTTSYEEVPADIPAEE